MLFLVPHLALPNFATFSCSPFNVLKVIQNYRLLFAGVAPSTKLGVFGHMEEDTLLLAVFCTHKLKEALVRVRTVGPILKNSCFISASSCSVIL